LRFNKIYKKITLVNLFLSLEEMTRGIMAFGSRRLWPNNEVPYVVEDKFSKKDRIIIAAVRVLQKALQFL
jgi:hypothetical protein